MQKVEKPDSSFIFRAYQFVNVTQFTHLSVKRNNRQYDLDHSFFFECKRTVKAFKPVPDVKIKFRRSIRLSEQINNKPFKQIFASAFYNRIQRIDQLHRSRQFISVKSLFEFTLKLMYKCHRIKNAFKNIIPGGFSIFLFFDMGIQLPDHFHNVFSVVRRFIEDTDIVFVVNIDNFIRELDRTVKIPALSDKFIKT